MCWAFLQRPHFRFIRRYINASSSCCIEATYSERRRLLFRLFYCAWVSTIFFSKTIISTIKSNPTSNVQLNEFYNFCGKILWTHTLFTGLSGKKSWFYVFFMIFAMIISFPTNFTMIFVISAANYVSIRNTKRIWDWRSSILYTNNYELLTCVKTAGTFLWATA